MADLIEYDLKFILASLASIYLCIEPLPAGLGSAVMGSALAICCRTVTRMKKWIGALIGLL